MIMGMEKKERAHFLIDQKQCNSGQTVNVHRIGQ